MRLAAVMQIPRYTLLERLCTQDELYDWMAFDYLEPLGGRADDERLAYLLMNQMQAATGGKSMQHVESRSDREPWSMADFLLDRMPRIRHDERELSEAEMEAEIRRIDRIMAGAGFDWREG